MLQKIKNLFYRKFKTSFAKSGIDIQMFQILKQNNKGFYIDIGSHHPIKGSNSFFFYLQGWNGICVDPNPEFLEKYKKKRPKDIFLNIGISDTLESQLNYYKLRKELSERNSFSEEYIIDNKLMNDVQEIIPIQINTLVQIFSNYEIPKSGIDFLSIDCEGLDLQVLKSNDWNRYRPKIVIVETHEYFIENDMCSTQVQYMKSVGYILKGKTIQGEHVGNLIFVINDL